VAVEPVVPARFLGSTLGAGVSLPLPECWPHEALFRPCLDT
jgi:hypothetical protein